MERELRRQVRNRVLVIIGLLLVAGGAIITRLFYLQVVWHQRLASRAASQMTGEVQFSPKRGIISDRNGCRLAVDVEVDSLYGVPSQVRDKGEVARVLAQATGRDAGQYLRELGKKRPFVWLQRRVSPQVSQRIAARGWEGVGFLKENKRFYPQRELAAQVLGVAGVDNQGLAGVELAYDAHLWRDAVWFVAERDALGNDILIAGPPLAALREGDEVRLTIDEVIQFIAQEELERGVREAGAQGGSIVILDPRSGDILAMANVPFFNPNEFQLFGPAHFRNRTISDTAEPGSIMKTFLLAAALEEKVVAPETPLFCENGAMPFVGGILHDVHPYGALDTSEVIIKSSNIGATKIALRLGGEKYHRYLKKFGFGDKTGVDLPGEVGGLLRPVSQWSGRSIASLAIGQEIAVTALQTASAFAAAVNGGELFKPRIVRELVGAEGRIVKSFPPAKIRRVISPETSRKVVENLVRVVTEGTGKAAAVDGYTVAGKTGTAQKYDPQTRTYSSHKYLASFLGVAPARDPRLVILVMVDEPQGAIFGGSVSAPVFRRVVQRALRYLNVAPEVEAQVLFVQAL